MGSDAASAAPRPDLTFLRRRSRPAVGASPSSAITGGSAAGGAPGAAPLTDFITGHTTHRGARTSSPEPSVTPRREAASSSLDLSAATEPASTPEAPAPAPAPAPSSSLDLSDSTVVPGTGQPTVAARAEDDSPRLARWAQRRIRAGDQQLLSVVTPTVALTGVQSGIGQLQIEAMCSPEVGDLRLGAAYELRSGPTSTVQYADGNRFAPSSRRPVIVAGRDEYEHLRIDLRQVPELRRLAVYAFSESRSQLRWAGTLVVTTLGGARIELPLESLYPGSVAVLMTIYNVEGELVVRGELETIAGDIREAARAYGYDRITWRDGRAPVE